MLERAVDPSGVERGVGEGQGVGVALLELASEAGVAGLGLVDQEPTAVDADRPVATGPHQGDIVPPAAGDVEGG